MSGARSAKPHELPYPTLSPDTDPQAEAIQLAIYRKMPSSRKVELVLEAIAVTRDAVLAGLRARYPGAGDSEIRRRFFGLWLGEELATRAYGPIEDVL